MAEKGSGEALLRRAKREVKLRDEGRCRMCGRDGIWNLHVHHIYPASLFPERVLLHSNMVTLCLTCHLGVVHAGDISDGGNPEGNWKKWTFFFRWLIRSDP